MTTVSNANIALTNNLVWTVLRDDKQQSMKHKVLSPNTTVLNIDIQFNAVMQLFPGIPELRSSLDKVTLTFNQNLEFFYNFNMFLHVKGKEMWL